MKNTFPSRAKTKVKPRKKPIKKKTVTKKKPPFCPECKGNILKGHGEKCPNYYCQYKCDNGLSDCEPVSERYSYCSICNAVWDVVVSIKSSDTNPHIPSIFEEAVEKFKEEYNRRFDAYNIYSFSIEMVNCEFVYNNFGDDNYWNFKFKANKK